MGFGVEVEEGVGEGSEGEEREFDEVAVEREGFGEINGGSEVEEGGEIGAGVRWQMEQCHGKEL